MSARCTGEPVSWLRLERHHLGEGDAGERARVAEHLAACPACAACLSRIEADDAVALPPRRLPERRASATRGRRAALAAGALALAAAVVLFVGRGWTPRGGGATGETPGASHVKGDGVAFSLVRDDAERIVEAGGSFHDGDRFKALVTCPPAMSATFDVVVYDEGGASFPLESARGLACGNDVALPGAFRLTGTSDETVCLVWSEDGEVNRGTLAAGPDRVGTSAMCKRLTAARP
ncbi:MAG TPA: hypothetical protein VIF15_17170 [Polyangiaceae bacterium]|jgi:hypothetical protein